MITLALFYGLDGSLSYVTQYTDGPTEEEGYYRMIAKNSAFFTELRRSAAGFRMAGPRIMYRPLAHVYRPLVGNEVPLHVATPWASVLGKSGIPYSIHSEKGPVMICGEDILDLSDAEMSEILGSGVFLDGLAAMYACRRGYGDLLGVEITELESTIGDTIVSEQLTELTGWREYTSGSRMYFHNLSLAVQQHSSVFRIHAKDEAVQVLSDFRDEDGQAVAPATILYENRLGGRVAVIAYDLKQNVSASVYNYKRKEQIRGIVEWLSRNNLPVYAAKDPNVFVSAQEHSESGDKRVAVFNMSLDPLEKITLTIDASWNKKFAHCLQEDGTWVTLDTEEMNRKEDKLTLLINRSCLPLQPLIVRFTDRCL
ncbi:hypothetical protein [Paenibacillus sp. MBLB4367]|uniref:hypothetical protein n=1 Tax=Paenibacillus sp. MBLB4367 TaxID=3384767 RepID=UPI0039083552